MEDYSRLSIAELNKRLGCRVISEEEKFKILLMRNIHKKSVKNLINKVINVDYLTVKQLAEQVSRVSEETISAQTLNKILTDLGYQNRERTRNTTYAYTLSHKSVEAHLGVGNTSIPKTAIKWHPDMVDIIIGELFS